MNFQESRAQYQPQLPQILSLPSLVRKQVAFPVLQPIKNIFPSLTKDGVFGISFQAGKEQQEKKALRLGCVLSGGQAPGGHNVIVGIYECLKKINNQSKLFGFLNGPHGIYSGHYKQLTQEIIKGYKNRGGFDMICSGRHKIETPKQFQDSLLHCQKLDLDGLIVIGGDDSNTNAALLAQYFLQNNSKTKVIGCPKTIDGDLKNQFVEVSFGFDTACKTYSESIGNIMTDCWSTQRNYHFIRLMGRSASHIALECGLLTRPNLVLIGEQVQSKKLTLRQVMEQVKNVIVQRFKAGKNYGVILVPEGLVEFIPEVKVLISEINKILSADLVQPTVQSIAPKLSDQSAKLIRILPAQIANQLLLDRDPHGNVQVAKIQTERLLIEMLNQQFKRTEQVKNFKTQAHYLGYEGRCAYPTKFDCDYCYGLGFTAAALISLGGTGLMSCVRNLKEDVEKWQAGGCPLVSMMDIQTRKGKSVPVITKALVDLNGGLFKLFDNERAKWILEEYYSSPGPIQFNFEGIKPYLAVTPASIYHCVQGEACKGAFSQLHSQKNFSPLMAARLTAPIQFKDLSKYQVHLTESIPLRSQTIRLACLQKYPLALSKSSQPADLRFKGDFVSPQKQVRIGICQNARQLPGCHNLIQGLIEAGATVFGFVGGTQGIIKNKSILLTKSNLALYRNLGGLLLLGRDKDQLRTPEELQATLNTANQLDLDGIVLVGGTHTLTDTLILSQFLLKNQSKTRVVCVPSSTDQSVCHPLLQLNLGFSTSSHFMASMVANLMTDASSNTKYWYFIRLMSKEMGFLVMETALKTKPNLALIGQQISAKAMTIRDVVNQIADLICERSQKGWNFGCIVLGDSLLSWISEFTRIIHEIDEIRGEKLGMSYQQIIQKMPPWNREHFSHLPQFARKQMLLARETNGSPKYNQIQTQRLLAQLVGQQLKARKSQGFYKGSFASVCHYFGYQGRSSMPSEFDAQLGLSYGFLAAKLIQSGLTGYCTSIRGLIAQPKRWHMSGIPLVNMLDIKEASSYGIGKLVIKPSKISLKSKAFAEYSIKKKDWRMVDHYDNPGPVQFFTTCRQLPQILQLQFKAQFQQFETIEALMKEIRSICKSIGDEQVLKVSKIGLRSLLQTLKIMRNRLQL